MIYAWSYSRYVTYDKCPFLAKCKFVDKLVEPQNDAMLRGTKIHKLCEDFLKGNIKRLPPELKKFSKEFSALKKAKPYIEEQWAFDEDYYPTDWFNKKVWLRVKLDACEELDYGVFHNIDFKTGKPRGEYVDQSGIYALGVFNTFDDVSTVYNSMWYLDGGTIEGGLEDKDATFTREDKPKLEKLWRQKVKRMTHDRRFDATPNYACQWCHFRKSNGGPCKHG